MEEINIPQLLFFTAIAIVIYLALQRWFLAVDAQLSNQKKIIELLTKLTDKEGGEARELEELKNIMGKK